MELYSSMNMVKGMNMSMGITNVLESMDNGHGQGYGHDNGT
jgi:hypothetical protein